MESGAGESATAERHSDPHTAIFFAAPPTRTGVPMACRSACTRSAVLFAQPERSRTDIRCAAAVGLGELGNRVLWETWPGPSMWP